MAVFRVEKTKDFTVMSNHHLRNVSLSLKAKGLLSLMLSLPDNWDYTTKGLAHVTPSTVRLWTTGAARPCSMARRLMQIYESGPEIVSKIAGESCPEKGGRQTSEAKEQTASCGK